MRKPSVFVVFLTVFIDLVGFGIVVPLVPVYSKHLVPDCVHIAGAQGLVIGVIIASFSAMQFLFAPVWGRLSDRHGRRPILLISTAGAAVSYALFGMSARLASPWAALGLIVLSRMLAGLFGGNITVAQAYLADITPPEQRSKRMGLIGMAFGLGFIFGPAIGGASLKYLGTAGSGCIAAALCAANFFLALWVLTESRPVNAEHALDRPHLDQWVHTLTQPRVGILVVVFFLSTFCISCFESTLPLVVSDNFRLGVEKDETVAASTATILFVFCGVIGAVIQGGAIGCLVKRLGEPRLIVLSLALAGIGMVALPFIKGAKPLSWGILVRPEGVAWVALLAVLAVLSVGMNLMRPPLFGLLSNLTPNHEQGATIGVAHAAGSLARILGPIFATTLLQYSACIPYLTCGAVLAGTIVVVVRRLCGDPRLRSLPSAERT